MPVKLFALNGVPDDEAEEVRELLRSNAVDCYETPAGNWGISSPAIWSNDGTQLGKARALIEHYQQERRVRVREEYAQQQREGKHRTLFDIFKENPLRFVVYLAVIAAVVYFSTKPFLDIGK